MKGAADAVDLASGEGGSCIVARSGKVTCWKLFDPNVMKEISGIDDAVRVAVGRQACVVRRAGTVVCWTMNEDFELGPLVAVPELRRGAKRTSPRIPTALRLREASE